MNGQRDRAAIVAPPPLLTVLCLAAGAVIEHFKPFPLVPGLGHSRIAICITLLIVAAVFVGSAIREFRTHNEDPSPYKPTGTIMNRGIYGHTRNPIYIGFLIFVLAVAVAMTACSR